MNDTDELIGRLRASIEQMVGDAGESPPPPVPAPATETDPGQPQRRWVAWAAAAATVAVLVGGLAVLANRDSGDDSQGTVPPAQTTQASPDTVQSSVPTSVPTSTMPTAPAEYEAIGTVIDGGAGAQLCPVVLDSLPPQCGSGVDLDGWSWDAIDVEQSQAGVTWVDSIYVRGTFIGDQPRFEVTEARIPTDDERERLSAGQQLDFSVPCPEPDEGWPARNAEWPGDQVAAIEGYAGAWVDSSQQVMTVKFTGDLAAAEAAVRQYYSDALCVVPAQHTEQELLAIQQTLMSMSSIQLIGSGVYVDATGEWVGADVIVPDPERQAQFDAEFGPGVVRLSSPFKPVGEQAAPPASTQRVEATGTVFQDGDATPLLCVGGVMESYPPQCADDVQPALVGWSWDAIPNAVTEGALTFGDAYVRGDYDPAAGTLTIVEQRPPTDADAERFAAAFPLVDHSVPCAEPEGGWPTRRAAWPDVEVAAIDGYAGAWGTGLQDGPVVTVLKFTGDVAAAEAAVRELYPGAVCVIAAQYDAEQLEQIRGTVAAAATWRTVDVLVDVSGEWVEAVSLAPQPDLQAQFDADYGPGVVRLRSLLLPAD